MGNPLYGKGLSNFVIEAYLNVLFNNVLEKPK